MRTKAILAALVALSVMTFQGPGVGQPQAETVVAEAPDLDRTPPRLAYTHGEISFWRAGAPEWAPALVNTPLAPGDRLYAAPGATLELQIGARAFVRGAGGQDGAEIGLDRLEPDYLQLNVMSGTAALDIRELTPGYTVDVNTPDGVLTIQHSGYFRIEAGTDRTAFLAYRGVGGMLTLEDGARRPLRANEQVVVTGGAAPRLELAAAPDLTEWDRWNHQRTDSLLSAASARYVAPGAYGMADLDRHGTWRAAPEYGTIWVPGGVPVGWAPYSTGRWIWDPYFGWTWVDDAPWGWAPYHYGRWVHVDGYWAWAPGPIVAPVHYAPALVAFLGPPRVTVSPPVAWVALGWGEPCVPWWGGPRFAGRPWWGGWGGPRVVNKTVVQHTTVVNVTHINVYRNADVKHAVVTVPAERFGRGPVAAARLRSVDVAGLRPAPGAPSIRPTLASLGPSDGRAIESRAPERRRVIAVRPPDDVSPRPRAAGLEGAAAPSVGAPRARLVTMPPRVSQPEAEPERRPPRAREAAADRRRAPSLAPSGSPGASPERRASDDQRDRAGRERRQMSAPPQIPSPASRSTSPSVSATRRDPGPAASEAREAPRPSRRPPEPPKSTQAGPGRRTPEIERARDPMPAQVRQEAPAVSGTRPPVVQAPGEARRPAAVPVVERAGRHVPDRIERRRPAEVESPRASASRKRGPSDEPGQARRGQAPDPKIERGAR
jgi:hypothetical protein